MKLDDDAKGDVEMRLVFAKQTTSFWRESKKRGLKGCPSCRAKRRRRWKLQHGGGDKDPNCGYDPTKSSEESNNG
jgi:hypothetical protein